MLWQVFAIAGQASAFAKQEDVAHAMLHWQDQAHHHHDDGTLAQDDSDESVQHVVADGCLGSTAIWNSAFFSFAPAETAHPSAVDEMARPWPPLDRLRRPPRLTT